MQITDASARHELQLLANGRASNTVRQYRRHVAHFAAWLQQQEHSGLVGDVTDLEIAKYMGSPEARETTTGRPKSPLTTNAIRSSLKGFFGYLHEAGLIPSNPTRLLRPATSAPPPPRGLSDEELQRLLSVVEVIPGKPARRDYVLLRVLAETGIRLANALALRVEDLELDHGRVRLRHTKAGCRQHAVMPTATTALLREFLEGRGDGHVFESESGGALTTRHVQRRLRSWCERAGLPEGTTPHSLRHSFAMRLYERSGDVLLVRQALGHRSLSAALTYAHSGSARVRAALNGTGDEEAASVVVAND